ncbi:hypothetical protein [Stakelama tenebrarum]|uniref:Uncharacterized protein n=1 Tax=Stakelama tenebrarum TaxID=2711215 RepID=A0A6G6Y587_9SPHN|nr:hypothetical protein [Sphingosinithalassobacter tenebrarum]QIG80114.1 hypothetical protein G5C33_10200 [Sphingosinithalassobacter tenebrarum]
MAQADTAYSAFDHANDTHFSIAEFELYKLRQIALALDTLGDMADATHHQESVELSDQGVAAVLRTVGYALEGVIATGELVFPRRGSA